MYNDDKIYLKPVFKSQPAKGINHQFTLPKVCSLRLFLVIYNQSLVFIAVLVRKFITAKPFCLIEFLIFVLSL